MSALKEEKIMSRFWSQVVNTLSPYTPGEQPKVQNLTKLNTNENPYGPSPKAIAAIQAATGEQLKLYSDPNASELKQAIADFYGMAENQVFVGNGSDEVLAHTFQALLKQDLPLMFPDISYSFYPTYCKLYGIEPNLIPLGENFDIQIEDYTQPNGGIIFPNPNAPTGKLLPLAEIKRLLQKNTESVVVVDEAYIDFGGETAISLVNEFANLLVVQTFSKSRSLAGLRVGFAVGHPDLIDGLERVKNSFNSYPVDLLAIKGGVAAMQDTAYFNDIRQSIIHTREDTDRHLKSLGFETIPSAANFIFAKHPLYSAEALALKLREAAVIVRYFNKPRIDQYLRITIGKPEEMAKLFTILNKIINQP